MWIRAQVCRSKQVSIASSVCELKNKYWPLNGLDMSVSLPAWSQFRGWVHQRSSSDGRGPFSGWAGSAQHEPLRSATWQGGPAHGSERHPGPQTSYSYIKSPKAKTVKIWYKSKTQWQRCICYLRNDGKT